MTQRAHEREIYKSKKRLPAPEVSKPKKQHKPEKNFLLQFRYTPEYAEKINKRADEFGVKEEIFNGWVHKYTLMRIDNNEWRTEGKYVDEKTAQMVLDREKHKKLSLYKPDLFLETYEYRIIHKEDYKKEKYK